MAGTNINEQLSLLSLTKLKGVRVPLLRQLVDAAGSATELFANLDDIYNVVPGISPQLVESLSDPSIIDRAKREMEFIEANGIKLICIGDDDYPYRLRECDDAPVVLHTLGNLNLNAKHIISVVGTRHATEYGKELCQNFLADIAHFLPDTLIVSGLAYGIDICAHKAALKASLPTVGVLAHGLDRIYPQTHRHIAKEMLANGGLVTEFMSETNPLPAYFVQRNRIVAGMADATVVIESASKGGSLITASLAQGYARDCFAFPGRVNDQYSCGCNELISRNKAALITSAYDLVEAMNWSVPKSRKKSVEPELFPDLSPQEQQLVELLRANSDGLQINQIVIELNIPISNIMSLLFELEMKGLVKAVAGGCYRALMV